MTSCELIRREIQSVLDTNGKLSKTAKDHIESCKSCAALYYRYLSAKDAVSADIDRVDRSMGKPDLSFMTREKQTGQASPIRSFSRIAAFLPRAAAVLVILLVPVFSYVSYNRIRIRSLVRKDIQSFTVSLYSNSNGLPVSISDSTEFIDELFIDSMSFSDYDIDFTDPAETASD